MIPAFVYSTGDACEEISGISNVAFDTLAVVVVLSWNASRVVTAFVVAAGVDAPSFAGVVCAAHVMDVRTVKVDLAFVFSTAAVDRIIRVAPEPFETVALSAVIESMTNGIRTALFAVARLDALVASGTDFGLSAVFVHLAAFDDRGEDSAAASRIVRIALETRLATAVSFVADPDADRMRSAPLVDTDWHALAASGQVGSADEIIGAVGVSIALIGIYN